MGIQPNATQSSNQQMISLEEPRQLILELCPKFTPVLDIHSIDRIEKKIQEQHSTRQPIRDASQENVQTWIKKVDALKYEIRRPQHLSLEKHEDRVAIIEEESFSLAKMIREFEHSIESFESLLNQQQQQFQTLRKSNIEPIEPSETELRLRIYRSFGVTLVDELQSLDSNDHPIKIRIRPPSLNDIHTLVIDHSKYTDFFYTNYVWEMCSLTDQ